MTNMGNIRKSTPAIDKAISALDKVCGPEQLGDIRDQLIDAFTEIRDIIASVTR